MYASILKGNKKDQFREAIVRKITVFFVKSLHKQGEGGHHFTDKNLLAPSGALVVIMV